ncbi:MAG: hypothetical protein IK065_02820 [Neisseriaceae bacterium]|nr:hypothetical protein [Neisseriaceae bacterium]
MAFQSTKKPYALINCILTTFYYALLDGLVDKDAHHTAFLFQKLGFAVVS